MYCVSECIQFFISSYLVPFFISQCKYQCHNNFQNSVSADQRERDVCSTQNDNKNIKS